MNTGKLAICSDPIKCHKDYIKRTSKHVKRDLAEFEEYLKLFGPAGKIKRRKNGPHL